MAKDIRDLLGYTTLTGFIQAQTPGLPEVLPDKFKSIKQTVIMDQGRYTQANGNRRTARAAKFGAAPRQREQTGISLKDVKLIHTIEDIRFGPRDYMALRSYNSYEQDTAYSEFQRQIAFFKDYFENFRTACRWMALFKGAIYVDGNGNLLPNSSGATETWDFSVNANNKNQLNGVITAAWNNPATDIPTQLIALRKRAATLTGRPLAYAFCGQNVRKYLTNNNYVNDYLSRNPQRNNEYLSKRSGNLKNVMFEDLFELCWVDASEAFYEDSTGTNRFILGDDDVVFTPEPSPEWWENLEGTYPVPTSINIQTDAQAAMNSLKMIAGMFAFAQVTLAPVAVVMYMGDTILPVIKNPDCVFQATTVF